MQMNRKKQPKQPNFPSAEELFESKTVTKGAIRKFKKEKLATGLPEDKVFLICDQLKNLENFTASRSKLVFLLNPILLEANDIDLFISLCKSSFKNKKNFLEDFYEDNSDDLIKDLQQRHAIPKAKNVNKNEGFGNLWEILGKIYDEAEKVYKRCERTAFLNFYSNIQKLIYGKLKKFRKPEERKIYKIQKNEKQFSSKLDDDQDDENRLYKKSLEKELIYSSKKAEAYFLEDYIKNREIISEEVLRRVKIKNPTYYFILKNEKKPKKDQLSDKDLCVELNEKRVSNKQISSVGVPTQRAKNLAKKILTEQTWFMITEQNLKKLGESVRKKIRKSAIGIIYNSEELNVVLRTSGIDQDGIKEVQNFCLFKLPMTNSYDF